MSAPAQISVHVARSKPSLLRYLSSSAQPWPSHRFTQGAEKIGCMLPGLLAQKIEFTLRFDRFELKRRQAGPLERAVYCGVEHTPIFKPAVAKVHAPASG